MSDEIKIQLTTTPGNKPDSSNLSFGKYFTDHMFIMDYHIDKGWHDPRIVPYAPISLDPAAMVFHYGQAVFEGMKAYLTDSGKVLLFRPDKNMKRLNQSNDRLGIPEIDGDFVIQAIKTLIEIDKSWIPTEKGTSLYVRPFIIATEPCLGVRSSYTYQFIVILSPVGAYYSGGLEPVKINVESSYTRAVRGGIGYAKAAGNYAASIKAQEIAKKEGFSQVLWLDAIEKKYIEEVGSMNIFFKIGGTVITPEINGSILEGVTRDSVITLLKDWGVPVEERKISIEEIYEAYKQGQLEEVFGTGTAAVISPVGELHWNEHTMHVNEGKIGELSQKLYDTITGLQSGSLPDPRNWTVTF
ncbi:MULTISPECIES: branched-chain amino acid aminotransferase [Paenibacillus]|uniref:Branched-chain-amino-acid aminotransferase n=1 Tax=Paenibacillus albilobatus TaxID=2716884 RepID=A0A919XNA1_9BACL|nr:MULTISPECIES: branched-chain amino acid aminotransferase [Paenibacillus]MDR9853292.1 branched-chain amino acid aminotransferase [Paenibacillus sp. VCA1]GIO34904.1 branched-chain-amino-acid aminotransferase 2 [Paenibacillus albilobatus]